MLLMYFTPTNFTPTMNDDKTKLSQGFLLGTNKKLNITEDNT